MKVICINNKQEKGFYSAEQLGLVEGEIYTVIGEVLDNRYSTVMYILKEIKSRGKTGGFISSRFLRVSDIDETKLVNLQTIEQ